MSVPSIFAAREPGDVAFLARAHPLAWVVSLGSEGLLATPLPLLAHTDADGRLAALEGHYARSNPQVTALRADPRALLLWMGPQGYVSPSWMADRTQAPTWNYASAQCRVRIHFDDDPDALRAHLESLVAAHEAGRPRPWRPEEMGARYDTLAARIVSFRAEPTQVDARFKLGQDERHDVYADILQGLQRPGGAPALCDWMRRFNPGRPDRDTT
jgi:transcriptional regulator